MKAHEPDDKAAEVGEEATGENAESSGRGSAVVLSVLGLVGAWRLVIAFPEVAYVVVGSLGTIGVQKARARWARSGGEEGAAAEKETTPDVGEALRRLVGDDNGVLLTRLRDDLKLPNTKAVKVLLDEDDITWKAVRTREGNGPAVHKEDIPPALSPAVHSHGDGCCCRPGDNTNTNNDPEGSGEKGIRVDRTDTGFTVYDELVRFFAQAPRNRPATAPGEGEASDR